MRVDEARGDPLVLTIDDFHPRSRRNVLLDASYGGVLDQDISLKNMGLMASLDGGRDGATFEQIFGHGVEVNVENVLWVSLPAVQHLAFIYPRRRLNSIHLKPIVLDTEYGWRLLSETSKFVSHSSGGRGEGRVRTRSYVSNPAKGPSWYCTKCSALVAPPPSNTKCRHNERLSSITWP